METLRLTIRDAIQEYVESNITCDEDPVEVACDIADVVFDALGISPKQQDIEGTTVKVIVQKRKRAK
jgi:hypothetical protein